MCSYLFLITGYFVAKKENTNPNYIKDYIKKTGPIYLTWSLLYIPILLGTLFHYLSMIQETTSSFSLPFRIKEIVSYYYKFFFTTRNFLFFGLFYVTLGYFIGTKEKAYSKYCFVKLILSFFSFNI